MLFHYLSASPVLAPWLGAPYTVRFPSPASQIPNARALLHDDLDHIFSDANFAGAQWGVEVVSLDRGEILYERNSGRLSMPASNNKILTTSSALIRLGHDYRYATRVMTDGEVVGETLKGNLVVVGAGDPSTAARFHRGRYLPGVQGLGSQAEREGRADSGRRHSR